MQSTGAPTTTFSLDTDSAEDIRDFYQQKGYVIFEGLFSDDDIGRTRNQVRSILETEAEQQLDAGPGEAFDTHLESLFDISDDYRHNLYDILQDISSLHRMAMDDNVFEVMELFGITQPALRDLGGLGLRIDLPGEDEFLSPIHQDVYPMKAENCLNIWAPLHDVSVENGALKIYPESHELGPIPAEEKYVRKYKGNTKQGIPETYTSEYDSLFVEIDAGDAVVFHPYLLHQSTPNRSDNIRWTATIRFDDATDIQWMPEAQNPYIEYRRDELL